MRKFLFLPLVLALAGCATLGLNQRRDLCQDARNALIDAHSAELLAAALDKGQDIAAKLVLAAEAAVAANCPAPVPTP